MQCRNSKCVYVEHLSAECRGASERVSFMEKCTNVTKADYFWKIQICSPGKSAGCNFFLRNLCKRSREIELAAKMPEFVKCHVWDGVKFVTCRGLKMFSTSNFCGTTAERRRALSITTPSKTGIKSTMTQAIRPYCGTQHNYYRRLYFIKNLKHKIHINDICNLNKLAS